jgi:hypothetical protein
MIEVLKQLVEVFDGDWTEEVVNNKWAEKANNALDSAKKAIAELEKQEPVAWLGKRDNGHFDVLTDQAGKKCFPVYTSPQLRKPLTDEMILQAKRAYSHDVTRKLAFIDGWFSCESTHGIKE